MLDHEHGSTTSRHTARVWGQRQRRRRENPLDTMGAAMGPWERRDCGERPSLAALLLLKIKMPHLHSELGPAKTGLQPRFPNYSPHLFGIPEPQQRSIR
jgi:hypothetical protein